MLDFSVPWGYLVLIDSHKWEGKHSFLLEYTFYLQRDNPCSFYSFCLSFLCGVRHGWLELKWNKGDVCSGLSSMFRVYVCAFESHWPHCEVSQLPQKSVLDVPPPLCGENIPCKPSKGAERLTEAWGGRRPSVLFNISINNLDDGTDSTLMKLRGGTELGGTANVLDNRMRIQMSSTNCRNGLGEKKKGIKLEASARHKTWVEQSMQGMKKRQWFCRKGTGE